MGKRYIMNNTKHPLIEYLYHKIRQDNRYTLRWKKYACFEACIENCCFKVLLPKVKSDYIVEVFHHNFKAEDECVEKAVSLSNKIDDYLLQLFNIRDPFSETEIKVEGGLKKIILPLVPYIMASFSYTRRSREPAARKSDIYEITVRTGIFSAVRLLPGDIFTIDEC